MTIESDLVPLPFYPWDDRPLALPLTDDEVLTALYLDKGHQHDAARRLHVDPVRLRRYVKRSARATAFLNELSLASIDDAERIIREAVNDSDRRRADSAARFLLTHSREGLARGYVPSAEAGDGASVVSQRLTVIWADGAKIAELGPPDGS